MLCRRAPDLLRKDNMNSLNDLTQMANPGCGGLDKLASMAKISRLDVLADMAKPIPAMDKLAMMKEGGISPRALWAAAEDILGGPRLLKGIATNDVLGAFSYATKNSSDFGTILAAMRRHGLDQHSTVARNMAADQFNIINNLTGRQAMTGNTLFPMTDPLVPGGRRGFFDAMGKGKVLQFDPTDGRYIDLEARTARQYDEQVQHAYDQRMRSQGGDPLESQTKYMNTVDNAPSESSGIMGKPWFPYAAGAGGMMALNNMGGRRGY